MTDDQIHAFIDARVKALVEELRTAIGPDASDPPRHVMFASSRLLRHGIQIGATGGCPKSVAEGAVLSLIDEVYQDAKTCRCCGELVTSAHKH